MTTSDSSSRILDVDRFEKVRRELMSQLGVTSKPHRFGGTEFQVKGREMGHMHGGRFADFPFPMSVHNELVKGGREWSQQRGSPIQWIRFQFRTWMHLKPLLTLGIMLARSVYLRMSQRVLFDRHLEPTTDAELADGI